MFGGESRDGFYTRVYVAVEAAQAPVPAFCFQQRCPHPRFAQVGESGVAQLVQCPARSPAEQFPGLLIRQPSPTRVRTHIWERGRLVGSAVGNEQRPPTPAAQVAG